ncbi:hypothetical protein O1611_g203 [Lasiodiplodia mahajangana]|uniref:Uncharacterized protein n=1 Tax=Lasiodiplodia mahajangana TaxID=1108764 RepID=A0ACC2K182_9PEZI|nr:hypothetical protein O1611_g203 [Lasiodiplodia mahajangana]
MAETAFDFNLGAIASTPRTCPPNMAEPSTIYSDINRRRTPLSDADGQPRRRHFYETEDLRAVAPQGFPSMAAMQTQWSNTGTFRTFEYLNWRQLGFYETKLSYLESQLHKLDVAEARKMKGAQRSSLPFNKKSFMDCCVEDSSLAHMSETLPRETERDSLQDEFNDVREKLYDRIECVSKKHRKLVEWLHRASTFPRVRRELHYQLFTAARQLHGLNNEAIEHFRAIDERAYVNFNPLDSRIQSIWLSVTPCIRWARDLTGANTTTLPTWQKILRLLCVKSQLPEDSGSQTYHIVEAHAFMFLYKALMILISSSLILLPVGILHLGGLSRALAFGVVVIFGVVFAIGLVVIEHRISLAVAGIIAYIAVLAAVLANVT